MVVDGRGAQAHRRVPAARPHDAIPPALIEVGSAASAEDVALAGLFDDGLAAAWTALSPELHDVLQAMVLDGLSVRETSALLGLPEGTVKTRARRARRALQEGLA